MKVLKKGISALLAAAIVASGNLTGASFVRGSQRLMTANAVETTQIWDGSTDTSWYDSQETELHITTAEELAGLAAIVNGGKSMAGQTIVLDNDIYLNSMVDVDNWETEPPENTWKSIGNETNGFSGVFDGGNHTIYGLFSNGFFGGLNSGAIQNVYMENAYIINAASTLCYLNEGGTISNCHVNSTVSYNKKIEKYLTEKTYYYGGMCGSNNGGMIKECSNSGIIEMNFSDYRYNSNNSCYIYTGGICGINTGIISDSVNNADIYNDHIINAKYSYTGGVIGYGGNGMNLHNTGDIDGRYYTGGITGYADADLTDCLNDGCVISFGNYDPISSGGISGVAEGDIKIEGCINNGDVTAYVSWSSNLESLDTANAGGIVGYINNYSHILLTECGNSGNVVSTRNGGGVAGYSNGSVEVKYCFNKGNVTAGENTGGLTGSGIDYIESSYNTGSLKSTGKSKYSENMMTTTAVPTTKPVTTTTTVKVTEAYYPRYDSYYSGGLCGYENRSMVINNSYSAAGNVSGKYAGGIAGYMDDGTVSNCYYLNAGANQGVGNKNDDIGITKSAVNMKKPAFAESLGSPFIYTENEYPVLYWEKGLDLITLNESSYKFTEYKQQFNLIAETISTEPVKWTSSDEKVAKVDQNGVVTALGNGNCSITANIGESKAICKVTVNYGYYIEESGFRLDVDKGKTITVFSKNTQSPVEGVEVSFTSDNERAATVNERGIVSANTAGVANIHINIGEIELICKVVVIGVVGDVNEDGIFNVADMVLLQKWILAVPGTELSNWKAADLCEDDRLDVFDLCLMRRALIENT